MPRDRSLLQRLILDACIVINLWAGDILRSLALDCGLKLLIVEQVAGEVLCVDGDEGDPREQLSWGALADGGMIERFVLTGEDELTAFLGLIPRLGDGEAASLAAARQRSAVLATDDGLALRVAAEHDPPVETVTTPDLVKRWADAADADDGATAEVIARIERRASYRPRPSHPLGPWWMALAAKRS